jgi:hypothetical protein
MRIVWEESTRDRHSARLPHGAVLYVERSRSWKKLGHEKPWRIVLFGNYFDCAERFADLSDAQKHAEHIGRRAVVELAKVFGCQLA